MEEINGLEILSKINYSTKTRISFISSDDYKNGYRNQSLFLEYCKACPSFGKTYACPPMLLDFDDYIGSCKNVFLLGTQIFFDESALNYPSSKDEREAVSHSVMYEVVDRLALLHDYLIGCFPKTRSFLVGKCRVCGSLPCARLHDMPCTFPDKVRHSLEAFGFDIGRTASELLGIELKWGAGNALPEYITLVTALITDADRNEFSRVLLEKLDIVDDK